jgi:hypothetical protein
VFVSILKFKTLKHNRVDKCKSVDEDPIFILFMLPILMLLSLLIDVVVICTLMLLNTLVRNGFGPNSTQKLARELRFTLNLINGSSP